MPRAKTPQQICSVEGCGEQTRSLGLCSKHYQRSYLYKRLGKKGESDQPIEDLHKRGSQDGRRGHKYYHLWFERKQKEGLCEEWLDFWAFVRDIGERPKGNYTLVRLCGDEPYGPENFEWREHLKRRKGESKKEWNARKWASRRERFPTYETNRWYLRKYGITAAQYEEMYTDQNGRCAICKREETGFESKTGNKRRLAVDHCHNTKKVRGLLCRRCNTLLGAIEEDLFLVRAVESYIQRHNNGRLL